MTVVVVARRRWLSWALRHDPAAAGILMDRSGQILIDDLLAATARLGQAMTPAGSGLSSIPQAWIAARIRHDEVLPLAERFAASCVDRWGTSGPSLCTME